MWHFIQNALPLLPTRVFEGVESGDSEVLYVRGRVIHLVSASMEGHRRTTTSHVVLHSQTKEFVYRLNRYFLEEKANQGPLLPPTQTRKRTAEAAGISEATVKRICSKPNKICDTLPQPNTPIFTSPKKRSALQQSQTSTSASLEEQSWNFMREEKYLLYIK